MSFPLYLECVARGGKCAVDWSVNAVFGTSPILIQCLCGSTWWVRTPPAHSIHQVFKWRTQRTDESQLAEGWGGNLMPIRSQHNCNCSFHCLILSVTLCSHQCPLKPSLFLPCIHCGHPVQHGLYCNDPPHAVVFPPHLFSHHLHLPCAVTTRLIRSE